MPASASCELISRQLFGAVPGYLAYAFAIGSQRIVSWQTVALAAGAGIIAACIAVLAPLRDILFETRDDGEQKATRRDASALVAAGLACISFTTAIVIAAPGAALAGLVTLMLALPLLLPSLLRLITRGFELVTRTMRTPVPTLAVLELRSGGGKLRTIALASTGATAVFASKLVSELPHVQHVRAYRGSFLNVGDHRAWVQAPPRPVTWPIPPTQLRHGDLALATKRIRDGGWVVLSEAVAATEHATRTRIEICVRRFRPSREAA